MCCKTCLQKSVHLKFKLMSPTPSFNIINKLQNVIVLQDVCDKTVHSQINDLNLVPIISIVATMR